VESLTPKSIKETSVIDFLTNNTADEHSWIGWDRFYHGTAFNPPE
jgi:hypothetical protein